MYINKITLPEVPIVVVSSIPAELDVLAGNSEHKHLITEGPNHYVYQSEPEFVVEALEFVLKRDGAH